MADRSIRVILRANVTDFNQQMRSASKSLADVAAQGDKTGQVAGTALGRLHQSAQLQAQAWSTVSTSLVAASGVLTLAVGGMVNRAADFDQAMSSVQAATHSTAAEMGLLREAAIQAGADTAYSATEAAGAIEELAKAGVSTTDILNGSLNGSLDLAAAGGLGVADAAGIASVALTQFGLRGSDVAHVADLLAAGAGKAMGDVQDLGLALKQGGLVASQTGLTIEETTAALAMFASAGLLGSDAGTSLKTMLQRLTPQSKEAAELMDELGLSAYDAQGNFVGLGAYAGRLRAALSGLTVEQRQSTMTTLFGADAIRAAGILYTNGAEGVAKWTEAVDDSGYASVTAATRMDNLKGDIEKLSGSIETAFIRSGSGANDMLRTLVQWLDKAVDAYGQLPAPVQQAVLGVAGFTAVGLGATGIGMKLFTTLVDVRRGFMELDGVVPAITRLSSGLRGISTGLSAAGTAVAGFGNAWVTARANGVSNIQALGQAATPVLNGIGTAAKGAGSAVLGAFGGPVGLAATAAIVGLTAAVGYYAKQQAEANQRAEEYAQTLDEVSGAATNATRSLAAQKLEEAGAIEAYKSMGFEANQLTDALLGVPGAADAVRENLNKKFASIPKEHWTSYRELDRAIGTVRDALEEQGASIEDAKARHERLDEATQETSASQQAMAEQVAAATMSVEDQADALQELVEAQLKASGQALAVRDAQRQFEAATAAATQALEKNGQTLDITTEAGRANEKALDDIARAGLSLIDSMNVVGSSESELQASMQVTRDRFIETAVQMGMNADEAANLADQMGLIPGNIKTDVNVHGWQQAVNAANSVRDAANQIPTSKTLGIYVSGSEYAYQQLMNVKAAMASIGGSTHIAMGVGGAGGSTAYAAGGAVVGPGTGTSDSIPALLSNGEHVLTAADVQRMGGHSGVYALRAAFKANAAPAYAGGGSVGRGQVSGHATPVMPREVALVDANGDLIARMRTEADTRIVRTLQQIGA